MLQLEHTDMNLEKKLSAIKAETVAANARVAANEHRIFELNAEALKLELELRKLLASSIFQKKQNNAS